MTSKTLILLLSFLASSTAFTATSRSGSSGTTTKATKLNALFLANNNHKIDLDENNNDK